MASAAARTLASVTSQAKQFQLFQPSGGVSAMRVAAEDLQWAGGGAQAVFGGKGDGVSALVLSVPVMMPVAGSSCSPGGKPSAAKVMGRWPLAGMVKRKGEPGRAPKILGPLMRGVGEAWVSGPRRLPGAAPGPGVCPRSSTIWRPPNRRGQNPCRRRRHPRPGGGS